VARIGGAVAVSRFLSGGGTEGSISIVDCRFRMNHAVYGGALALTTDSDSGTAISNTSFTDNSAQFGGAIAAGLGSRLTIDNASFSSNTAGNLGGAMYFSGSAVLTVRGTHFSANQARTAVSRCSLAVPLCVTAV